mgnify:CR=1 FL=1
MSPSHTGRLLSIRSTLSNANLQTLAGGAIAVLLGVLLAIFWTGFLRVGSQISLFLAPVAMTLLLVAWFSDFDKVLHWT